MTSRLAPAALVAALLVATSAAFVVTEKLKLTRNPIVGPRVDKIFSPSAIAGPTRRRSRSSSAAPTG